METHKATLSLLAATSFNFLASLINGNSPEMKSKVVSSSSTTFNFLASLINGNFSSFGHRDLSETKAFNFLASLINGNLCTLSELKALAIF